MDENIHWDSRVFKIQSQRKSKLKFLVKEKLQFENMRKIIYQLLNIYNNSGFFFFYLKVKFYLTKLWILFKKNKREREVFFPGGWKANPAKLRAYTSLWTQQSLLAVYVLIGSNMDHLHARQVIYQLYYIYNMTAKVFW